ncbi:choline ethanolaminephosphotransferase [Lentinula edodes]|nr:choline ethanolaminephosphotransferase [Lentinula edodes]
MNSFWTWFVTLFPLSIAPNTIMPSRLCILIFNFFTLLYYDPSYLTEKGEVYTPQWIYFTWGIGLFLYQAFDAADGKQARRTGMAGPLGEMFDHGTSPRSTRKRDLEAILVSQALNLGRSWWTLAFQVATLANFYLTTWEEYRTSFQYLGVFLRTVEGILIIVVIYMITDIYAFWYTPILDFLHLSHIPLITNTIPNLGLNVSFMIFGPFGLVFNILSYANIHTAMRASGKSTLKPPFPFYCRSLFSAGIQVATIHHPQLHTVHPVPLLHWNSNSHQVGRMILAHLTKGSFPVWDWLWLLSLVGAVDANLPRIAGTTSVMSIACFTVRNKDKERY